MTNNPNDEILGIPPSPRLGAAGQRAPSQPLPGNAETSAIDLVVAAARSAPDAIALRSDGARITYRDLMASADRLADAMQDAGVGADVPVGICLERGFDFVIAMLAASRAGGAFLPLDPAWPEDRLRFVLRDAGAPVLVTSPARAGALEGACPTILPADATGRGSGRPRAPVAAGNLAYIIYTSGSSGEPKGVEITHANLLHLLRWHNAAFGVTRRDHASCVAGLGFDAVVWELWPYLAVGASISLAGEAARTSAEALRQWLIDAGIDVAFVPTPLAETMISTAWPANTALRYLLTGGDTLHVRPAAGLPFAVVNNYGPSECAVVATSGLVAPSDAAAGLPDIGRPIAGARIHILDEQAAPVGPGEIGEICIGGTGVGRGYRGRQALTAERFVSDPFSPDGHGARMYRTGDLGCWLPDGQIAFHGRRDNQVKIRGYRVELDEISVALNHHPMVAQSAVIGHGDGAEMQLVAYVVPAASAAPGATELRDFLAASIPEYMLPSAFVELAVLPLTASGKLDRKALPPPTAANVLAAGDFLAPASVVESRLAGIVAAVLELDRVGVEDNFFLLGGHSLLGAQVVLKARDAFGAELTLRDLFQAQTVRKLAAKIESRIVECLERLTEEETSQLLSALD